jgi:hypothetical protein
MFVPCGEDGEPLEYPHYYSQFVKGHLGAGYNPNRMEDTEWCDECKAYQIAQSRVLFEGWDWDCMIGGTMYIMNSAHNTGFSFKDSGLHIVNAPTNIDELIHRYTWITPTQSAKTILNLPE